MSPFANNSSVGTRRGRGRPPKFGRAARVVAITLPHDVLKWLEGIHPDPAWAIVSLFETARPTTRVSRWDEPDEVELAGIGEGRALITVDYKLFKRMKEVAAIPLSAGRAFLALAPGQGMADLELAVDDYLEDGAGEDKRGRFTGVRQRLRELRRDGDLRFETRSIIVVNTRRASKRKGAAPRARR
jgi:hypothetical protein